jgi:acetylornithine/N-succinyldiaminopimelate aminotransferase
MQAKYQKDFGPLTPGFEYVEYNDLTALRAKVKAIQSAGNGQGLAAIFMESLQGEGGKIYIYIYIYIYKSDRIYSIIV